MKNLLVVVMMLVLNLPAQAMVFLPGTPRPVEGAKLKISSDRSQTLETVYITKFRYEQTERFGFTLNMIRKDGTRTEVVYDIKNIEYGNCGEVYMTATASSDRYESDYYLRVVDFRKNMCMHLSFISQQSWKVELRAYDSNDVVISAAGVPEPIFTTLSVQEKNLFNILN